MKTNSRSNQLIRNIVIMGDFVALNILLWFFSWLYPGLDNWTQDRIYVLFMTENMAMLLSQWKFSTRVHERRVTVIDMWQQVTWLIGTQVVLTYVLLKVLTGRLPFIGRVINVVLAFGPLLYMGMIGLRILERYLIKRYRRLGGNIRTVLLIGEDPAMDRLEKLLKDDPARGYRILKEGRELSELKGIDEVYCCLPRSQKEEIRDIARYCDAHVIRFYYVRPEEEDLGIDMKVEQIEDMRIYTMYEVPLADPVNKILKRLFDIVFSFVVLLGCALLFPFLAIIIKMQSPGPVLFKQLRTGMNGKDFWCYKFRSMHVNKEADSLQATEHDPRKFAFGDLMRKTNIDELPQFWCVLLGDMSVVGPRPHMLKHTEEYSQLIEKYMVRHFIKPGITGWAQVTGFRGETKELWQMEERVKRDIWYAENWSIWLDLRIIWMTIKTIFIHDKKAY